MHISEGVLSAPVLATGAVLAAAGVAVGLKKMDYERGTPSGCPFSGIFCCLAHPRAGGSLCCTSGSEWSLGIVTRMGCVSSYSSGLGVTGPAFSIWRADHFGHQHLQYGHARRLLLLSVRTRHRSQAYGYGHGARFRLRFSGGLLECYPGCPFLDLYGGIISLGSQGSGSGALAGDVHRGHCLRLLPGVSQKGEARDFGSDSYDWITSVQNDKRLKECWQ